MPPVLDALERFYDAVPRVSGSAEAFGSVTLFRAPPGGFPYYLRPTLGHAGPVAVTDVRAALDRQRELGLPRTAEWVAETTPSMLAAAERAGLSAHAYPLMVRGGAVEPPRLPTRMLTAGDADVPRALAVAHVAFSGGALDVDGQLAALHENGLIHHTTTRLGAGRTALAAAYLDGELIASGQHNPVGDVTEIVGVATLPTTRRRGAGQAVTAALVADATARGIGTVFLSAADATVARIYGRLGFAQVGTAMIAEAV